MGGYVRPLTSSRQSKEAGEMRKRTWARLVPIVAALALAATGCGDSGGSGGGGGGGARQVTGLEILVGTAPAAGSTRRHGPRPRSWRTPSWPATSRSRTCPAPATPSPSSAWSTRRATARSCSRWGWAWSAASTPTSPRPPWTRPPRSPGSPRSRRSSWSTRTPPTSRFDQLLAAWKADPGKVSVGGGSAPGGPTTWPRC